MEILLKENKVLNDSEIFYFNEGNHIQDDALISEIKQNLIRKSEIQYSKLFQIEKNDFHYGCYFIGGEINEEDKIRFSKRIRYFIRCREQGSVEFILCISLITKREILLEYLNGFFQRRAPDHYLHAILERAYVHLFNKEVHSKYRFIGYSTNVGFGGEVLTKPLFVQLMQEDVKKRVLSLFGLSRKTVRRGDTGISSAPPSFYDKFVVKRINSVIALSDFLVTTLTIKPQTYVLLRLRLNRIYFAFLNIDNDEYDIHLHVNKSSYARIKNFDTRKFPMVIYLKYVLRIDLFLLLENEVEYELDPSPEFFENNYWYRLID